jgi:branched-chain amino acid transport system permease protein
MQKNLEPAKQPSFLERAIKNLWIRTALLILIFAGAGTFLVVKAIQNPPVFFQQLLNGLQLGFVYALIALGYTMIYGIVKLINFAHGDVFMVGAFTSFYLVDRFHLNFWPELVFPGISPALSVIIGTLTIIILSMAFCALLAFVIERFAYKPLRDAPRISALITAIGVSFFLEYFGALNFVYTPNFITYQRPFELPTWFIKDGIHLLEAGSEAPGGAIIFPGILIVIVLLSLLLLALLQFIVRRTKIGKAMRAVAYDKPTSRLMGIKVDTIISVTFGIGASLAGVAGILYATAYKQVYVFMGIMPGLKAFVSAVLGGIGSIPGALVGALILGQAEVMTAGYISTPMRDAVAFGILILVLLVRPTGIFGEPEREKA